MTRGWLGAAFPGTESCSETLNVGWDEADPGWETLLPSIAVSCQLAQPKTGFVEQIKGNRSDSSPPEAAAPSPPPKAALRGTWMGFLLLVGNSMFFFRPKTRCSMPPSQLLPPLREKLNRTPQGQQGQSRCGPPPGISVRHTEIDEQIHQQMPTQKHF